MADPGEGPWGPGQPLFYNQNEAQRAEKHFFGDRPPCYLRVWMTAPRPLFEGLDPSLTRTVLDSGLHAGFRLPGTGFQSLPVELGFWILWALLIFQIPMPRVPDSNIFSDFGFHKQKFSGFRNSDSLTWSKVKVVNKKVGWFSNRTGSSVDDCAGKSNNWLDQWQSGNWAPEVVFSPFHAFPVVNWCSRPVAKSACLGWFSNRTGTSVDDGARKSNNWLDRWHSGKLSTGSRV